MTTPQAPAVRSKQKRRRTKQLAAWRAKKAAEAEKTPAKAEKADPKPAKKAEGKKTA